MPEKRKRGRPKKTELAANKKGNRGAVGRPKGDAAVMNEYKAMMLTSPKSRLVLTKIFDAALDDDHKNQSAAWKLLVDRIAPVSLFDNKDSMRPGSIEININTVGSTVETKQAEVIDAEVDDET